MATGFVLRLVANMYPNEMGGFGAEESDKLVSADRLVPQWNRIVQPLQLLDAAKFYACWKIFISADESDGDDSMLAHKAGLCMEQHKDAVQAWDLVFNLDPDTDDDADISAESATVQAIRL